MVSLIQPRTRLGPVAQLGIMHVTDAITVSRLPMSPILSSCFHDSCLPHPTDGENARHSLLEQRSEDMGPPSDFARIAGQQD